jgi:hypothetical protein
VNVVAWAESAKHSDEATYVVKAQDKNDVAVVVAN